MSSNFFLFRIRQSDCSLHLGSFSIFKVGQRLPTNSVCTLNYTSLERTINMKNYESNETKSIILEFFILWNRVLLRLDRNYRNILITIIEEEEREKRDVASMYFIKFILSKSISVNSNAFIDRNQFPKIQTKNIRTNHITYCE